MEASDDELVGRAAAGDRLAFAALVERHRRRLVAQVSRILGARGRGGGGGMAEDVVQEVFVRAWTRAPEWQSRGGSSYAAWLSRVAGNLAIDGLRRATHTPLDDVAEPPDPTPGAEEAMVAVQRAERLRLAVAALPERQRRAIALTYDAELSNGDGAAAMGTSVGAFELLLVRARRTLRLALREEA